jgi:para-aminobenzoate synthetase component 1
VVGNLAGVVAALPSDADLAVVRDGRHTVIAVHPDEIVVADGADAPAAIEGLEPGWWAGFLAYELGRVFERSRRPPAARAQPDLVLGRFPARAVFTPGHTPRVEGHGRARAALIRALERAPAAAPPTLPPLGPAGSSLGRDEYERGVQVVLEHLRAGDCYQVNLTRRLEWPRAADPVALWAALRSRNPAPHLALLRLAGIAVVSASPECFLHVEGRRVETRPIKGTGRDAARLQASAKDRAENVMIVDMARNDLGRVCVPGSVQVPALCAVEHHPGLVHLVSTVRGTLRTGVGPGALLAATFPPASVTGAPKPRVMEIIEALEPVPRGVYCGAVGWLDTAAGRADLAVAIRTFTVTDGVTMLGVGAGIVADSRPAAEWAETELKAARLLEAAGALDARSLAAAS